jgi:hypothetical protein
VKCWDGFLKEGHILCINDGKYIKTDIPTRYVYSNWVLSDDIMKNEITVGKKLKNKGVTADIKDRVIRKICEVFRSELGFTVNNSSVAEFFDKQVPLQGEEVFDTSIFKGEYVVTFAQVQDGGYMHEQGQRNPWPMPDYYLVKCKKLNGGEYDPSGVEVEFVQEDIIPIAGSLMKTFTGRGN